MKALRTLVALSTAALLATSAAAASPSSTIPCKALPGQVTDLKRAGFAEVVLEESGVLGLGESSTYRVYLRAGRMYGLVAGGCADALDIDVTVQGPRGELIAGDNDESRRAALALMPERTGMYTVTVTMWKARNAGGHFALSIAHGG